MPGVGEWRVEKGGCRPEVAASFENRLTNILEHVQGILGNLYQQAANLVQKQCGVTTTRFIVSTLRS